MLKNGKLREMALAELAGQLAEIGSGRELTGDDLVWLKEAFRPIMASYNPSGWDTYLARVDRREHYLLLEGWAKKDTDPHQQFLSLIVNGECAYECFLSDYPVRCDKAPRGAYGFSLGIDLTLLRPTINLVSLVDFDSGAHVDFCVFWNA